MKNNKKGFTIVELVIVIAVIAILAAVLIPTFSTVIKNANRSAALQEAKVAIDLINADEKAQMPSGTYTIVSEKFVFTYTLTDGEGTWDEGIEITKANATDDKSINGYYTTNIKAGFEAKFNNGDKSVSKVYAKEWTKTLTDGNKVDTITANGVKFGTEGTALAAPAYGENADMSSNLVVFFVPEA